MLFWRYHIIVVVILAKDYLFMCLCILGIFVQLIFVKVEMRNDKKSLVIEYDVRTV